MLGGRDAVVLDRVSFGHRPRDANMKYPADIFPSSSLRTRAVGYLLVVNIDGEGRAFSPPTRS